MQKKKKTRVIKIMNEYDKNEGPVLITSTTGTGSFY